MRAYAGMPCHHPKWPRHCPRCHKRADGFNVTVPLGLRWDPDSKKMKRWAWGTSGMACFDCKVAIIPDKFSEGVSERYVRALIAADILCHVHIETVPEAWFEEHCCSPAEEAVDAEVHTQ